MTDMYAPTISQESLALEAMRVSARTAVSRRAVLSQYEDFDIPGGELVYKLDSYVLAEKLEPSTYTRQGTLKFPSSPWQFFKERHASSWWLGWLVQRRPVRSQDQIMVLTVQLNPYRTYPNAQYEIPELGKPVILERTKVDVGWAR